MTDMWSGIATMFQNLYGIPTVELSTYFVVFFICSFVAIVTLAKTESVKLAGMVFLGCLFLFTLLGAFPLWVLIVPAILFIVIMVVRIEH